MRPPSTRGLPRRLPPVSRIRTDRGHFRALHDHVGLQRRRRRRDLQLLVSTSEENSVVNDGYDNISGDLDPGDGNQYFANYTGNPSGGDADTEGLLYYEYAAFTAPSGTNVYAQVQTITNFKGNDCYVDGWFLNLAG